MDWSIAPSFVEETSILVEGLEEVDVGFRAKPFKVADFKVGPLIRLAKP